MTGAISLRQWNRTLLERQHLIERVDEDAVEVVDRCVGLQSQDPQAAFYALASRIEDFDPAELDSLIQDRSMVRMALQWGTVFLMDALDARWIRALLSPTLISVGLAITSDDSTVRPRTRWRPWARGSSAVDPSP